MSSDIATVGTGVGVKRGVGVRVGLGVGVMVIVGVTDGPGVWIGAARVRPADGVRVGEAVGVDVFVGSRLAVGEGEDVAVGVKVLLPELEVKAAGTVGSASTPGVGLETGPRDPVGAPATSSVAGGVPQATRTAAIIAATNSLVETRASIPCTAEQVGQRVILASVVLS